MATPKVQYAPGAKVDSDFMRAKPGIYVIRYRLEGIPMTAPKNLYFDQGWWTRQFAQSNLGNVVCRKVEYAGQSNARDENPAWSVITVVTGGSNNSSYVADWSFDVTVEILNVPSSGMGAVQMSGPVMAALILVAAAAVFQVIAEFTGKNYLVEGVKALVKGSLGAVGEGIEDAAKPLASGILVLGLAAVAVVLLMKKSGGRISTKYFSTS